MGFYHYYIDLVSENLVSATDEIWNGLEFAQLEFFIPYMYFISCLFFLLIIVLFTTDSADKQYSLVIFGFMIIVICTLLLMSSSIWAFNYTN